MTTTPPQPTPIPPSEREGCGCTEHALSEIKRRESEDNVRWLALLLRQSFLLAVKGIEKRYGLEDERRNRAA